MIVKHLKVRDRFGEARDLSEMEECVVEYLLRHAEADSVMSHLHTLDQQHLKAFGTKPEQDTDRLMVLLDNIQKGQTLIEEEWIDSLFTYVMKINHYHTAEEY